MFKVTVPVAVVTRISPLDIPYSSGNKIIKDLSVDFLEKKDTNNEIVQWAKDNQQSGSVVIDDPRAKVYDFKPGFYALVCAEIFDTGGWKNWPATALEVR